MRRLTLPVNPGKGPPLRRRWNVAHVTLIQAAALVLPVLAATAQRGPGVLVLGAAAIATALIWEAVFARLRHRAATLHGLTTGLILAVMAPETAPLWQIVLAASFGAVIAELVFGGRGFGLLNAGLAALAFLAFSFPGLSLGGDSAMVAIAALPGGAALLLAGLLSWRVLLATLAGFAGLAAVTGLPDDPALVLSALAFGLIFLVADPMGGACTNWGRVLYGLLVGAMAALFQPVGAPAPPPEALVFAALVGGVFAPLLDDIVIRAHVWHRGRRHV